MTFFNKNRVACRVVDLEIQGPPAVPRIPNQIILRGTTCRRLGDDIKSEGCLNLKPTQVS